jgi:hypothetical protein
MVMDIEKAGALIASGVACTMMAFVAGIMLVIGVLLQRKAAAARGWPTVPGTVIDSRLIASETARLGTIYRAGVTYRYEVNGQTYTNDLLAVGAKNHGGNRGPAERDLAKYPVGQQVQVHYNPQEPTQSMLETRVQDGIAFFAVAAILLVLGPILMVVAWFAS